MLPGTDGRDWQERPGSPSGLRGPPLPCSWACADWAVQGQRLGLTDGILQRKRVLRMRGLCPPSVPIPDGRARLEGCLGK